MTRLDSLIEIKNALELSISIMEKKLIDAGEYIYNMKPKPHFTQKWRKSPSGFELTNEDLHNLFDYFMMTDLIPISDTLKLNNMDKWYDDFITRLGKKAVPELYEIKLTPPIPKNFFKKKKKVKR